MKKKTKVNKKKLDSLLLVLLLTAVLLIMSTYAWFTANRTVTIGSIDVHVETSSGLMISANGKEWGTSITVDDIKNAKTEGYTGAKNQLPFELSPVSTALQLNGEHLRMFYGDVVQDNEKDSATRGEYFLTTTEQEEKDGNEGYYVAFDVFLKSGNDEDNLYLSGDVKEMTRISEGNYEEATTEKGITNAARVAIIRGNNTTNADSQSAVTGLTTSRGEVMMWEPNYNYHTKFGVENAEKIYSITDLEEGPGNDYTSYAGVSDVMENVKLQDAISGHGSLADVNYKWASKKYEEPSLQLPADSNGNGISKGATKYRIYMWIEGQDVDCENNASGAYAQLDLNFSLDAGDVLIAPDGISR